MRRIVFLNRFFFPDHSATSQILTDLAFCLADAGREVHVVTSQQKYDEPKVRLPGRENARGGHIHRVATTRFGGSTLVGRGIDYLSFLFCDVEDRSRAEPPRRPPGCQDRSAPDLDFGNASRQFKRRLTETDSHPRSIHPQGADRLQPALNIEKALLPRSLHPPITACGHRVRFVATWREEFFELPLRKSAPPRWSRSISVRQKLCTLEAADRSHSTRKDFAYIVGRSCDTWGGTLRSQPRLAFLVAYGSQERANSAPKFPVRSAAFAGAL
jgi:hypothetical protein